jgi:hypothetical protein
MKPDLMFTMRWMWCRHVIRILTLLALAAGACFSVAARDDVWNPTEDNPLWRNECGTCHMAFPPGFLASDDWLAIMAQLNKHFGVDASLDPSVSAEIAAYLKRHGAGDRSLTGQDELPRLTMTARFEGKHRSAIRLWSKGQLKSLSDCGACHKDAVTHR